MKRYCIETCFSKMRYQALLILLLLQTIGIVQAANPIDTLEPGQWYEVPNSKIRAVVPPYSAGLYDSGGPVSIIGAWNGGAYDTKRERYIVWGGGHGDYAGNEVYGFDLATLQWQRLNEPSSASALNVDQAYYNDGQPSSRHTYDYTLYVPSIDRYCSIGGAPTRGSGSGSVRNVDCFNFDTLKWERKADAYYWGIGARAAYNPSNGRVYAIGSGGCAKDATGMVWSPSQLGDWDPIANVWSAPIADCYSGDEDMAWKYHFTVAIDPVRQKLYGIGEGLMFSYDLTVSHAKKQLITPLGANEIINVNSPGLTYDPVTRNLVAWAGGTIVYTYNPDTNTWSKVSPAASNTVVPSDQAANGTYNRFQYIPSKNAFIIVNSIDENVFVYKLPVSASSTPTVSFSLTSPVAQTLAPFSLGQAFKQGDIPSGLTVTANIPNFQASVKSRWPDGSVQYAILSGRANLQANTPLQIDLSAGADSNTAPVLTEQDLIGAGANAQVSFGNLGSVELSTLLGVQGAYDAATQQWSAGKVRDWVQGPEMSSWIYSAPIGTDASLSAWYEVRLWQGGQVEIVPWLENGYLLKPGATQKDGVADVSINHASQFNANLSILHHTRTLLAAGNRLSYWVNANDPQLSFKHDTDYLQKTKLVPSYAAKTGPTSPLFTRLPDTFTPFAQGAFPSAIGQTGYHPSIGLLPEWDVAYFSTGGDARALKAIAIQAYLAGRYGIHYRDETTNRPPRFSSYPNLVLNGANAGISGTGSSTKNQYTPPASGVAPPSWATSHAPSVGYLAYLLYGRFYFLEELEFAAATVFLKNNDFTRQGAKGIMETATGANTTRGAAWALRTVLQANLATPDGDLLKQDYKNTLDENFNYYYSRYIAAPNNPQGIAQPYSDYTSGDGVFMHATWMEDFLTAAFGYMIDTQAITPSMQPKARQFFNWKAQSVIGRLGSGAAGEYDFRDAARYYEAVAPSDAADWITGTGPWYSDWAGNYLATLGVDAGTALPNQLRGAYFPESTGYWGNLQPAIAYAVIHNAPGAQAAYARMTGAANWPQFLADANNNPVWSVVPNQVVVPVATPDTQAPSVPGNVVALAPTTTQINLSWNAASDNVGVVGYRIYRDGVQIATTANTSYQDSALNAGTSYSYTVSAYDAAGNVSGASTPATAATHTVLSIPGGLTAVAASSSQINLSWQASTGNTGPLSYKVYRDTQLITTTANLYYQDTALKPGTAYAYTVSAYDAEGNYSAQTNSVSATTLVDTAKSIDSLSPGQWYEVPNSKIRNVLPPADVLKGIYGSGGPASIVSAWSGGGYDSKRDRYIVWGGGGSNYAGNELYAFDVNSLKWARLTDPSPASALIANKPYYADGKPSSRNTFDYTLYVPSIDRYCSIGGAAVWGLWTAVPNVDCFNFDTLQWERKADTYYFGNGTRAVYNPSNGKVYALGGYSGTGSGKTGNWDPIANVWTKPGVNSDQVLAWNFGISVALDSIRQQIYGLGRGAMFSFDVTTQNSSRVDLKPTGDTEIIKASAPGVEYDPIAKKLVAWAGGAFVYTYDQSANTWTKIAPTASNQVIPPAQNQNGTFNRFKYIPSKNAYIVVNSIDSNVFIYKLPSN